MVPRNINSGGTEHQDHVIRALITQVIRESRKSRAEIAEAMSTLTGHHVSVSMLNDYSSKGKKQTRFPLLFVAAFCTVTCDNRLRRFALGERLSRLLSLGEHRLAAEREIRALLDRLLEDGDA